VYLVRLCLGRPAVGFTVLGCVWPASGLHTAPGNPKNIRGRGDCGGCCGMFACRRLVFCLVCIIRTGLVGLVGGWILATAVLMRLRLFERLLVFPVLL
jgi:hypothetical protein